MVHIRSEMMGTNAAQTQVNPMVDYVSNLTPTGYLHTTPTGHTSTSVVEGDRMRLTTNAEGRPLTAILFKKK